MPRTTLPFFKAVLLQNGTDVWCSCCALNWLFGCPLTELWRCFGVNRLILPSESNCFPLRACSWHLSTRSVSSSNNLIATLGEPMSVALSNFWSLRFLSVLIEKSSKRVSIGSFSLKLSVNFGFDLNRNWKLRDIKAFPRNPKIKGRPTHPSELTLKFYELQIVLP